jgi:hypothetical protein
MTRRRRREAVLTTRRTPHPSEIAIPLPPRRLQDIWMPLNVENHLANDFVVPALPVLDTDPLLLLDRRQSNVHRVTLVRRFIQILMRLTRWTRVGEALGPNVGHEEDVGSSASQPIGIGDLMTYTILQSGQNLKAQHSVNFGRKSTYVRKRKMFNFNTKIHHNLFRSPKIMERTQGGGFSPKEERSLVLGRQHNTALSIQVSTSVLQPKNGREKTCHPLGQNHNS